MPEPQPSDSPAVSRPRPAAVSEALACELAMLDATLPPPPTPAAEAPQQRAPPEEPGKFAGR